MDDDGSPHESTWVIGVSIVVMSVAVVAIAVFIIIKCCCRHDDVKCGCIKTLKGSRVVV